MTLTDLYARLRCAPDGDSESSFYVVADGALITVYHAGETDREIASGYTPAQVWRQIVDLSADLQEVAP